MKISPWKGTDLHKAWIHLSFFFYIQPKESGVCPAGTTKGQETLGPPGRHGLEVGKGCWPNTLLAEQHRTASPRYLLFVNEICSSVQVGEGLKSTNNSSP